MKQVQKTRLKAQNGVRNLCVSLAACALLLSACGFHPVYGVNKYTATGVEEKLESIDIADIPDREGQFLRNDLMTRFYRSGQPASARFTLKIGKIHESITDLDITKDADSTRGQLRLTAGMNLIDNATGQAVLERGLIAIVSYNILASEFTNRVSEQNARENALRDLARQIEQHIALYLKRTQ